MHIYINVESNTDNITLENIIPNIKTWLKKPFNMTAVAFVIFSYVMLPVMNSTMLRWFDELSLFEPNKLFWTQVTSYPSGLLKYIGTFLIQFLYYPWIGSTLLIALWLSIAYLSRKAFNIEKDGPMLLLFIVPMCLLCSVAGMDESWLTINSQGYFFSQTIGTLVAILLFLAYRSIKQLWLRTVFIVAVTLSYLPLGYYAVLAVGMCAVYETTASISTRRWIRLIAPIIGVASMTVVPWIYYSSVPGISVDCDALYIKGLPEFSHDKFEKWMEIIFATIALILATYSALPALNQNIIPSKRILSYSILMAAATCVISSSMSVSKQIKCSMDMLRYVYFGCWAAAFDIIKNP